MKKTRFSVLSVLTLLVLGACASGCGSGVDAARDSSSDEVFAAGDVSDTVNEQPAGPEEGNRDIVVRQKESDDAADGELPGDSMAYKIEKPAESPATEEDSLNKIPATVTAEVEEPASITATDGSVDAVLTQAPASKPEITPSSNGVETGVQPPTEYVANNQVHMTMEPYQEPETEYQAAPYASATREPYQEPQTYTTPGVGAVYHMEPKHKDAPSRRVDCNVLPCL